MLRLLSIDVGIKNLSYCYLETSPQSTKVIEWKTLCITDESCRKAKVDELTCCMLQTLMDTFDHDFEADVVLIENQPMLLNGVMKTMSVVIYTYFNMLKIQSANVSEVRFISATNKLKCERLNIGKKNTYKDRKKLGVEIARAYIDDVFPGKSQWFESIAKKDDYSDTLCQAIYYIETVLKHKVLSASKS